VMKGEDVDVRRLRGKDGTGLKGVGANAFRDGNAVVKGDGTGAEVEVDADWGKKARKRQVASVEKRLRDHEIKRKMENGEADDKDIMDLLVDYEEGEEGW
jgi:hypothetical protein